jgi:hypothetical protein
MSEPIASAPCPSCGKPAFGQFCSSCGAPLGSAACAACGTELTAGAKFCHLCGTPLGAVPAGARSSNTLAWAVAGIAFLALVGMVAGQRLARSGSADDTAADPAAGAPAMGAAPDISQMTPEQRAERLYDRMMGAFERGRMDTVQMFAPMATQAYLMLDSLNLDQRYDLGRLAEISGNSALARAEADTILKAQPSHLLGLILAARAARMRKDEPAARGYLDRLIKAEPAERAKQRPEYLLHAGDITLALTEASKR